MPALGWYARELIQVHIQIVSRDMAGNVDIRGPTVNTFLQTNRKAANTGQAELTPRAVPPAHNGTYALAGLRTEAARIVGHTEGVLAESPSRVVV